MCSSDLDLQNVQEIKPEIEKSLLNYDLPHYKLFFISTKNLVGIDELIKEIFNLNSNEIKTPNDKTEIIKPKIFKLIIINIVDVIMLFYPIF